jgi:purine nucleoside phosphorylase
MPEAALAKEVGLCYATLAVVANRAAGRASGELSMQRIQRTLATGMQSVQRVLERVISTP